MSRRLVTLASALTAGALATACTAPASNTGSAVAPASTLAQPASQWVMTCQPDQQARVSNVVRDGVASTEVTCVDVAAAVAAPVAARAAVTSFASSDDVVSLGAEPIVPARRTVRTIPAVYTTSDGDERVAPTRRVTPAKRSVKKSAIIIGSSAGAGAGLGAIVGGKKGALIGAAIGGGSAAVWDQVTRHR